MVNAPAPVVLQRIAEVIPIRVLNAVWVALTEEVDPTPIENFLEGFSRVDVKVRIVGAAVRVIDINGLRRDIEVAEPDGRLCRIEVLLEVASNAAEPRKLERVLVSRDILALRNVGVDYGNPVHHGLENACVFTLGTLMQPVYDALRGISGKRGYAVEAFHPAVSGVVAGLSQLLHRKVLVLNFRLLQTHHIGLMLLQPVKQDGKALAKRVYVVGGDLHVLIDICMSPYNGRMKGNRSPLYVTSLIAGAFFMENLDGTIIATALPQMARSFHVGAVNLNIGMTAYLLTLAVLIPISGWVADRFGSRSVFAAAIGVFTIASLLCGLSQTLTQFTLMRILQGLGGAMMVPVGRLIVLRETPKDRLTQAIAYITWPGLTALVLGPPLGGFITSYASWHWIFFINLPIGALALVLALLWVENVRSGEKHPFDWLTFVLAGLASSGTVFAMEKLGGGEGTQWRGPTIVLVLSLLSGALAILLGRRNPDKSLIDFDSMKRKSFSLSVYGASAFRIAVSVLPFLLPLMFQIAFGLNAFQAGLYLLALFAGDLSMKAFVIQVLRKFGFRNIIIVNGVLTALSMVLCALLGPATAPVLIVTVLFVHGACRSMQFTCMSTLAYTEVPPEKMSRANGFLSAVWQLSMGMGVAVGAITLRLIAQTRGHSVAFPRLGDFQLAIVLMAILALGPVFDALGLAADAGASTSGHQQPELETSAA